MAARADLNGIKSQIASILSNANTTTASPIDLSSNLSNSKRVQQVLKVNPERINIQSSSFPLVTCYVDSKTIRRDDIATNQLSTKRRATVQINVVGTVWNDNYSAHSEDPADEDINYLMENIELILRSDHTLGNKVNWQKPTEISYYTTTLQEANHLRSGVLKLDCEIYY